LAAKGAVVFVRTHDFRAHGLEVRLSQNTNFPTEIIAAIGLFFIELLRPGRRYCAAGVILVGLEEAQHGQLDLFGESFRIECMERLFQCIDGALPVVPDDRLLLNTIPQKLKSGFSLRSIVLRRSATVPFPSSWNIVNQAHGRQSTTQCKRPPTPSWWWGSLLVRFVCILHTEDIGGVLTDQMRAFA
jgi:hypothetical protein